MATIRRPMLVIIWPLSAYSALLTLDERYIFESAPIMRRHAAPGTPTEDVVTYYTSHGAVCQILRESEAQ